MKVNKNPSYTTPCQFLLLYHRAATVIPRFLRRHPPMIVCALPCRFTLLYLLFTPVGVRVLRSTDMRIGEVPLRGDLF